MKGTSKVIMGATLVMVVSLAIVLGLILVLLAELYCSLLLRRRRFRPPPQNSTLNATAPSLAPPTTAIFNTCLSPRLPSSNSSAVSLSSFYSRGVICAPRNFLFPAKQKEEEPQKARHYQLHQTIDIGEMENPSPLFPPSPEAGIFSPSRKNSVVDGVEKEILYISNPIFDGDSSSIKVEETPFETPNSSPSALQKSGSSSSSSSPPSYSQSPVSDSPPLFPMKLPDEACSVSLGDAGASQTWNSDSNSNNGRSSSSTGSPYTSPSW